MGCSATVTYPVAATNSANWALVTGCRSIEKASTLTVWIGASSGEKLVETMRNDPDGRATRWGGMGSGYDDGEVLHQRGFRGTEPRRILRPFQVNGDQIFIGVGTDVGDAIGEFDGARWPEECSGELLAAVSAELDTHRVDLEIGLRTRQRGNIIGEVRRRIAYGLRDGHPPGHSVRAAEGQRHVALPRLIGPGFRDR